MSGRHPRRRGRWIITASGREMFVRSGERIPRSVGYTAFGSSVRFAPRGRPSSRVRRRSGASYGAGIAGTTGGSRVAPTQRFGTGARAGYAPAELKVYRSWTDPSGVSPTPAYVTIDGSGYTHVLADIDSGASYETRVGNGVRAKKLTMHCSMRAPAEGVAYAGGSACIRMLLIRAKNASGSLDVPTAGKVFEYTGSAAAVVSSPMSHSGNGKYTILDDRRVVLNPSGETGSSAYFDLVFNIDRNIVWEEDATGEEFLSGGLYLLLVSNQEPGATAAQKPSFLMNSVLSFTDS